MNTERRAVGKVGKEPRGEGSGQPSRYVQIVGALVQVTFHILDCMRVVEQSHSVCIVALRGRSRFRFAASVAGILRRCCVCVCRRVSCGSVVIVLHLAPAPVAKLAREAFTQCSLLRGFFRL